MVVRRQLVLAAGLAAAATGLTAGCGVSARDEYARIRAITITPQAGDGTTVASLHFNAPTALGPTEDSLAMTDDTPR